MFLPAFALIAALSPPPLVQEESPAELFNRAVAHYNERRVEEAHTLLSKVIKNHPKTYFAYSLWWKSTGKVSEPSILRETLQHDLTFLESVEQEERSEAFYYAVMECHSSLGNGEREESWRREAIERLPRSKVAQQDLLQQADDTEDAVEACELYAGFIESFPGNVSWSMSAARKRFDRMVAAPEHFETESVVVAGRSLEAFSHAFAKTYGRKTNVLLTGIHLAGALFQSAPEEALAVADRLHAWVLLNAPQTEEFDAGAAREFLAFRVVLQQREGGHQAAIDAGDELFPPDDMTRPYLPYPSSGLDESDLRHAHGMSLAARGLHERAVEQLTYAAHLNEAFQQALDDACQGAKRAGIALRDPLPRLATFDGARREHRKSKVLRSESHGPAAPFDLRDLSGERVRLSDFKGKVLILNFWATW